MDLTVPDLDLITIELVVAPPDVYRTPRSRSPSDTPVAAKKMSSPCAHRDGEGGWQVNQRMQAPWVEPSSQDYGVLITLQRSSVCSMRLRS